MIKENQKYLNRLLVILDAVVIVFSLIFAWYIRFKSGLIHSDGYLPFRQYLRPVICIIPIYLFLYDAFNLYTPYRFKSIYEEFINIVKSVILGILIFIMVLFLFRQIDYSRYLLFIFTVLIIIFSTFQRTVIRLILRNLRIKGYNLRHILLVGYSDLSEEFIQRIDENKQWGYELIGVLDDNFYGAYGNQQLECMKEAFNEAAVTGCRVRVIGSLKDLESIIEKFNIDEIFITLSIVEYEKLSSIIKVCEKSGIRTQIIPDYFKYIPARPYVEEVDGLPIINIRYVPLDNLYNKFLKRLFDIIFSVICIIAFSPIMIVVCLLVKLTSPGPILFKQERIGFNNKPFIMYKFRSMKLQNYNEEKLQWTVSGDPRKTKFGSFIRKTCMDELPQFFNVLKGDMSLIGPRPERPYFVEKFKEEIPKYMVKHQVRPGMTGWAQVNGWRGDTSIEKRIEYDIYYIENWSLWMDIKILVLTIFKGFIDKNAY